MYTTTDGGNKIFRVLSETKKSKRNEKGGIDQEGPPEDRTDPGDDPQGIEKGRGRTS